MTRRLSTAEAVETVLSERLFTKYRLGQALGCGASLVNRWLSGTNMGPEYRAVFKEQFDIEVVDATKKTPARNS
ncbi:MAG: hypothetical protein ACRCSS_00035 [Shewanella sp.]